MSGPRAAGRADGPDEGLPARRAALAALRAVDEGAWSNLAVPAAVAELPDARDRALASHLAYDTVRFVGTLDWALTQVLTRDLDAVETGLLRVLRLGALQLLRTDVPAHAAVSTSVALARESVPTGRAKGAGGFVNGVLRQLDRRRSELAWPDPATDPVGDLVLRTAHPRWAVEDLRARLGHDRAAAILAADDVAPGVTLRATGDRDALVEELRATGLEATPGAAPQAIRAPGADPRRVAAVREGRAVVQDEASQRVVLATGVRPGARVLDLCAGPGGKTGYLASLVGADGPPVVAVEQHPHRARLVREAAARLGVAVDVRVGDATTPPLAPEERFDVVLLDAPCTGLGVGRRRPEVRWRRTPEDVRALAALQRQLLTAAARCVAPGGQLTYAVCTWTRAETDEVAAHLDELLVDASAPGGPATAGPALRAGDRWQLTPDVDDTDGMYVATWVAHEAGDDRPG